MCLGIFTVFRSVVGKLATLKYFSLYFIILYNLEKENDPETVLQPQRFPRGCLPAASGEKTDPPSVREMSAPAQPPTEGAEGTAPGGGPPGPPPNTSSNRRLQQTQAQVEEVVDIMRVNVDKVLKRDEILSELDDRADALQMGASQFESSAAKLKRKYWWKNCKMMIMLGAICAIIVVVIVTPDQAGFSLGENWSLAQ